MRHRRTFPRQALTNCAKSCARVKSHGQTPRGPELRGLQARHERLRRHIFDLQQGPSAPSHLDHLSAQREWVQSSARTERLIALADYSGDAQAKKELDAIRAASVRQEA